MQYLSSVAFLCALCEMFWLPVLLRASATVISEDLRKTLEQRNTAAAAADEAPPMSAAERRQHSAVIAEILEVPLLPLLALLCACLVVVSVRPIPIIAKLHFIARQRQLCLAVMIRCAKVTFSGECLLQTGETVTRALKRLGAQKAARQRLGKRQPSSGEVAQPPLSEDEQKAVQAQFDRLTEAASALMDSGDLDVYSQDKVRGHTTPCCCVPCVQMAASRR